MSAAGHMHLNSVRVSLPRSQSTVMQDCNVLVPVDLSDKSYEKLNVVINLGSSPSSSESCWWPYSSSASSPLDQNVDDNDRGSSTSPTLNTDCNVVGTRYKTELCRSFQERGECKYGNKCQFAHGPDELKTLDRHPRYKTELCRRFHSTGFCSYGTRCHFLHDRNEQQLVYGRLAAEKHQRQQAELAMAAKLQLQATLKMLMSDQRMINQSIKSDPLFLPDSFVTYTSY